MIYHRKQALRASLDACVSSKSSPRSIRAEAAPSRGFCSRRGSVIATGLATTHVATLDDPDAAWVRDCPLKVFALGVSYWKDGVVRLTPCGNTDTRRAWSRGSALMLQTTTRSSSTASGIIRLSALAVRSRAAGQPVRCLHARYARSLVPSHLSFEACVEAGLLALFR